MPRLSKQVVRVTAAVLSDTGCVWRHPDRGRYPDLGDKVATPNGTGYYLLHAVKPRRELRKPRTCSSSGSRKPTPSPSFRRVGA